MLCPCAVLDTLPPLCPAALPLTEDHKPDRADEQDRIESKGGTVVFAGTWRVSGVLAVRALLSVQHPPTWLSWVAYE